MSTLTLTISTPSFCKCSLRNSSLECWCSSSRWQVSGNSGPSHIVWNVAIPVPQHNPTISNMSIFFPYHSCHKRGIPVFDKPILISWPYVQLYIRIYIYTHTYVHNFAHILFPWMSSYCKTAISIMFASWVRNASSTAPRKKLQLAEAEAVPSWVRLICPSFGCWTTGNTMIIYYSYPLVCPIIVWNSGTIIIL